MGRRFLGIALCLAACAAPHRDAPGGGDRGAARAAETGAQEADRGSAGPGVAEVGPPPPPLPREPLRVLVGGDLIPHRPSLVAPASIGAALAPLAPLFARADGVVANHEAATGAVDDRAFRLAYAAPPGWLDALGAAGITSVTVANNHACDLGTAGLDATVEAAGKAGLPAAGAGDDPWAPRVVAERSGKRVCLVAWTTFVNAEGGCARTRRLAVAGGTREGRAQVGRALDRARAWCDATIAVFHGGQEYAPQTQSVLDQAQHAAEAGADAVVVHHPHVPSPVVVHETRDRRRVPIFASVGNLVTNQGESWKPPMFPVLPENRRLVCVNAWTRLGVLADLAFTFEERGARLDWGYHLIWIDNEHADDRTVAVPRIAARLLDPRADEVVVARLRDDRRGPRELFADPCWIEGRAAAEPDGRCAVRRGRPAASPAPVARKRRRR